MSGRLLFALCSAALSVAGTNAELSNAKNPLVDVHATVEGSTSSGLQNDLLQRKVGGRVVQPVMLVSLMAALLGLIFVVAHCVKNMGGQQTSEPRLVLRRLAEAGDPCSVSRCVPPINNIKVKFMQPMLGDKDKEPYIIGSSRFPLHK